MIQDTAAHYNRMSRATVISLNAQTAIAEGDTRKARDLFRQAGELVESCLAYADGAREKQYITFLAAEQQYRGGHYNQALRLLQTIPLLGPFGFLFRDTLRSHTKTVLNRTLPTYPSSICGKLKDLLLKEDYREVLSVLIEHPYVLTAHSMALCRAIACASLGEYETAIWFYSKAKEFQS